MSISSPAGETIVTSAQQGLYDISGFPPGRYIVHGMDQKANFAARLQVSDFRGGFNGSTQHQLEIYLQDFEGLNSLATVDSKLKKVLRRPV